MSENRKVKPITMIQIQSRIYGNKQYENTYGEPTYLPANYDYNRNIQIPFTMKMKVQEQEAFYLVRLLAELSERLLHFSLHRKREVKCGKIFRHKPLI